MLDSCKLTLLQTTQGPLNIAVEYAGQGLPPPLQINASAPPVRLGPASDAVLSLNGLLSCARVGGGRGGGRAWRQKPPCPLLLPVHPQTTHTTAFSPGVWQVKGELSAYLFPHLL